MNGILRTPAAKLIISGNAADQAVITCRYTVMLVQIQVRQCIDIDTKLRLFRQIGRGLRIQSVDTFYYQNMIILQHCFPFLPLALPRFEVEQRHMHCFLMQQLQHGVIKQLQIQCLQSFEIIASIRQPWTVLAVFIEIIHRDRHRFFPKNLKVNGQTSGKGCLSCRARSCNQNEFRMRMPLYNGRRKLCQLLFYHRFAHQHQIIHIALLNLCIQLCNIGYTNQPAPGFKLLKHMKQLCLILKSVSCGQPDTRCIKTNGKMCEIGGIRQHDAVKIIIISA